jgi:nitroimidazol reductase NimA-like FMN-containing flavoprotein (pyridoxamine 5'-phosphate oxidase superfamily)
MHLADPEGVSRRNVPTTVGGYYALHERGMTMTLAMTRQERERFLAALHVGIISIPEEGRGPLTVPVWYAYEPGGELRIITGRTSRKGRLLEKVARISLCVQTEVAPYQYVSVEGPIVGIVAADVERDLRPLARRYLGAEAGDAYVASTRAEHVDNVVVRMRPERWLTVDFTKAASGR